MSVPHYAERFWLKLRKWYPWLIGAVVMLSSNLAASAIMDTVGLWSRGETVDISYPRILYIAIFTGSFIELYRRRDAIFRPHTRLLAKEPAERRRHLVLFLSNLPKDLEKIEGIPPQLKLSGDLDQDIDSMVILKNHKPSIKWQWEMPLRAIRHHLGVLQTVTLICSAESPVTTCSMAQAHLFLNICKRYRVLEDIKYFLLIRQKGRAELLQALELRETTSFQGWDFEGFDELSRAVWSLLSIFKKKKFADQDIMIDFTGGQKVTSVVASTVTFNRQLRAQYVQTNDPWDVWSYDVILEHSKMSGIDI